MTRSDRAAAARILARYKRAVLMGRATVPLDAARRLVGPDCAYHLYGQGHRRSRRRQRRSA